jgi:phospholipid/cholesterol/gamma-HCH transport system permease protein
MQLIYDISGNIGRRALKAWKGVTDFSRFVWEIVISFQSIRYLRFRSIYSIVINQARFTGINALPFVIIVALLLGATVLIQAMTRLPEFGVEDFIGDILVVIVARELGPLITAFIVIGRSGSAIAAEIATQKQNREIASLEIMGIDTRLYIVFPRIVASILSIFSLIIIFDVVAFMGGYIISRTIVHIPLDVFGRILLDSFTMRDILSAVIKSITSGLLIPLISCYYGFKPTSKFEIPIFVSKAVSRTLIITFVTSVIISVFFYF